MALGILPIILIVILAIIIIYIIMIYNGLVKLKNDISKSWANIDVLLKQRADEIPNLVEAVKGYMKHERGTLKELTEARVAMMKAGTIAEKAKADNMITGALKSIFAVAEDYPKLEANQNFLQLQSRISGLENELADRREFYNDSVTNFNTRIQTFPDMIIAKTFKFNNPAEWFKAAEEEKKVVQVKL